MNTYLDTNVFDEALNRIRMVFDNFEDIIVSMSGGKDSTVVFNLALTIAKEKGRLPLKVFWLDQEAEWQHTVDYMDSIMRMPEVEPYWYQIPFDFTNSLSAQNNFLRVFDESQEAKWIHPKSDISIKENPTKFNRFHELIKVLPSYCSDKNCAVLVGMRASESPSRRLVVTAKNGEVWHGCTWCAKPVRNTQRFFPIYDFNSDDVWTAIARNKWAYNQVYDIMYRWGVTKPQMRVSALIHETAWTHIEMLQEFEPNTYNRFCERVHGVSTFSHSIDAGRIVPKTLPFAFKSWLEYRDYLLEHITKPEYREIFKKRWHKQTGDDWYALHVKEVIINDIDGTINDMHDVAIRQARAQARKAHHSGKQLQEYLRKEKSND